MALRGRAQRACAALLLALVTLVAAAPPSQANPLPTVNPPVLNAEVSMTPERVVTIVGSLTNSTGAPVAGAPINAIVDANPAGSVNTNAQGAFQLTIQVGQDVAVGDHNLFVVFPGTAELQPVQKQFVLRLSDRPETVLAGTPDATYVEAGTQVLINGKLTIKSGGPAVDALIDLYGPSGRVTDSTTTTEADGSFSTFFVVPADQPAGEIQLTAKFDGDGRFNGSSASWKIRVSEVPPSPTLSTESDTPTPVESPASGLVDTTAEPSSEATSTPAPTPADRPATSMLPIVLVTGILIVGATSLAFVAIVLRRRRRRERDLTSFIDPHDADGIDAHHAPVYPGEGADQPGANAPSAPRRGIPVDELGDPDAADGPPPAPRRG